MQEQNNTPVHFCIWFVFVKRSRFNGDGYVHAGWTFWCDRASKMSGTWGQKSLFLRIEQTASELMYCSVVSRWADRLTRVIPSVHNAHTFLFREMTLSKRYGVGWMLR